MIVPTLVAVALGPLVAGVVWRAGLLTNGGALTAAILGSASALAGLDWMVLLLSFFCSSVLLGRIGRTEKLRRSAAVIEKAGPRDATQVLANGVVFGLGAVCVVSGATSPTWPAIAIGGLAAAMADTWGTEIGMLSKQSPRSILTWAPLETGMSGGVSALGLVATAGGAILIALLARLLGWSTPVATAGAVGGFVGAMADSILGATLQQRRRSTRTGRGTERTTDADGWPTVFAGGLSWLDNDGVNFAATLIGAGTAFQVHFLLSAVRST